MDLEKARDLIGEGKPDRALDFLISACKLEEGLDIHLSDLLLLQGRYKNYERDKFSGIREDASALNSIMAATLQLIDKMQSASDEHGTSYAAARILDHSLEAPQELVRQKGDISIQDYDDRYFPALDFKLQNVSQQELLLFKFHIDLLDFKIDITPVLEFSFEFVRSSSRAESAFDFPHGENLFFDELVIRVFNNGWGRAADCRIRTDSTVLEKYFPKDLLTWEGAVESGEGKEIARIPFDQRTETPASQEALGAIHLNFNLLDEENKEVSERGRAQLIGPEALHDHFDPFITEGGFALREQMPVNKRYQPSEGVYISILEEEEKRKSYSISHLLPPKGFERFHIIIGAKRSCFVKTRIGFEFSDGDQVWTGPLNLKIWNPVNARYHEKYYDGGKFRKKKDRWILFE